MNTDKLIRILTITTAALVALYMCLLVFNAVFNYGSIKVSDVKDNSLVTINGAEVKGSLRVRPGTYTVMITNKDFAPFYQSISVDRFNTITVQAKQDSISTKDIIATTLGFNPKNVSDTDIRDVKTFDNGTIIAGNISQGSYALFVLQYHGGWKPIYYQGAGFQKNLELVTNNDAKQYISSLIQRYSNDVQ